MAIDWSLLISPATEDELNRYAQYRKNGGKLDFLAWRASFSPLYPPGAVSGKVTAPSPALPPAPVSGKANIADLIEKGLIPTNLVPADLLLGATPETLGVPTTGRTTESPLPPGVTLTGKTKFIKEDEYGEASDKRWYRLVPTLSVGGVAPAPTVGMGADLEWYVPGQVLLDRATGKFYDADGQAEITSSQAADLLWAYNQKVSPTPTIDWQKGLKEAEAVESRRRWDIQEARLAREEARLTREEAERPELQRKQFELQWEIDRQRLLGGLAPDDWITRYLTENMPNPYKKQPEPTEPTEGGGLASSLEKQLDRQTGQVQALEQIALSRLLGAGSDSEAYQKAEEELTEAQSKRDATYQAWSSAKKEARDWSPQPTPQPYPSAPGWLPKYAPGQVTGRMITPENVVTPSGQQLTQMEPSIASKLGYFADWTAKMGGGRNWRDILGEAELMQPFTPRGAGGFRTSPARQ